MRKYQVTILLLLLSLIYPGNQSGQKSMERNVETDVDAIYSALNDSTLNPEAFRLAMQGYQKISYKGLLSKSDLLTLIDYSRPSNKERFYVIDLEAKCVLYRTLVAHGRNSGELYANRFSNKLQSHQTALGFYITGITYKGGQGYSLLMNGVDTGFNDNAKKRSIVIHGADYVSPKYIALYGRLGRSFGCPALPLRINNQIIDLIKEGSLIFSYYPDEYYLNHSKIIGYMPESNRQSSSL